jgi:hypothetical protein
VRAKVAKAQGPTFDDRQVTLVMVTLGEVRLAMDTLLIEMEPVTLALTVRQGSGLRHFW